MFFCMLFFCRIGMGLSGKGIDGFWIEIVGFVVVDELGIWLRVLVI